MKIVLTFLVLTSAVHSIPVSLRFIFMPKLLNRENSQPHQPEFTMQSRSDAPLAPFSFMEPMMDQPPPSPSPPHPITFTAQARMAPQFLPDPSTSTMQRRMDADEELLSQMPFSPQRRMDDEVMMEQQEMAPPMPFVPLATAPRQMGPAPMPFLVRMPIPSMEQQQPFMSVSQPEERPPMRIQLPIHKPQIEMRAFPIEDEERVNEDVEPEVDEPLEEVEENEEENPMNVRSQRILVIESAQRLRPVVMDSLQTVMKIFNAVAPRADVEVTTSAPEVNVSSNGNVEKMAQKLDRSLEMLTMQVADALGTLTAHAKQMLPMLMKGGGNVTSGIVENANETTAQVRADEPAVNNEIKASSVTAQNIQNVTDTVTKFVQFSHFHRKLWKKFQLLSLAALWDCVTDLWTNVPTRIHEHRMQPTNDGLYDNRRNGTVTIKRSLSLIANKEYFDRDDRLNFCFIKLNFISIPKASLTAAGFHLRTAAACLIATCDYNENIMRI
uniref:Uncharacterized protein n=1 Tax=Strigamia maritima TaxID=126957 RepID=T1J1F8_STRMM